GEGQGTEVGQSFIADLLDGEAVSVRDIDVLGKVTVRIPLHDDRVQCSDAIQDTLRVRSALTDIAGDHDLVDIGHGTDVIQHSIEGEAEAMDIGEYGDLHQRKAPSRDSESHVHGVVSYRPCSTLIPGISASRFRW